jgi:hypothetical protein
MTQTQLTHGIHSLTILVSKIRVSRDLAVALVFLGVLSTPALSWMAWSRGDFKGFAYFWIVVMVIVTISSIIRRLEHVRGEANWFVILLFEIQNEIFFAIGFVTVMAVISLAAIGGPTFLARAALEALVAMGRLKGVWPIVATCALTALIGALFFYFRLKLRFFYGLTESAAGIAIAGHRFAQESGAGLPADTTFYVAVLTAGVYLVVRGFDNMHQAWVSHCDPLILRLAGWGTSRATAVRPWQSS